MPFDPSTATIEEAQPQAQAQAQAQSQSRDQIVNDAATDNNLDPHILGALIHQESGGKQYAVSSAGAAGLTQLMPDTAKSVGVNDIFDEKQNIHGGARYLRQMYDRFDQNPYMALAAYNAGPAHPSTWDDTQTNYAKNIMAMADNSRSRATRFDPSTATPVAPKGFDPSSAVPVEEGQPLTNKQAVGSLPMAKTEAEPVANRQPLILGDSLASKGGLGGMGVVGANPQAVQKQIEGLKPEQVRGQDVVLSSGTSNNVNDAARAEQQINTLKGMGARSVTLLGVGDRADIAPANQTLEDVAQRTGATFQPLNTQQLGSDRVHPTGAGYQALKASIAPRAFANQESVQTAQQQQPYQPPWFSLPTGPGREAAQTKPNAEQQAAIDEIKERTGIASAGRIWDSVKEAWDNGPTLEPKAQEFLNKWGLGGSAQALTGTISAMSAFWAGASTTGYELARSVGGEEFARDVGAFVESAGMTGAPHVPGLSREYPAQLEEARQAGVGNPEGWVRPEYGGGEPPAAGAVKGPEPPAGPAAPAAEEPIPEVHVSGRKPSWEQLALHELEEEPAAASEGHQMLAAIAKEEGVDVPEAKPEANAAEPFQLEGEEGETPEKPPISQKPETPYEPLPREPIRLNEYLRRPTKTAAGTMQETTIPGGIKDVGGDLKAIIGGSKGRPGLINNKSGRSWDDAAVAAWEAGYFPEHDSPPSINELQDAMRDDHAGTRRYSVQDQDRVEAYHQAMGQNDEVDRLSDQYQVPATGNRAQFFDQIYDRMSVEDRGREIAEQDAASAAAERAFRSGAKEEVPDEVNDREFYGQSQFRTLEDLEREREQETATPATVEHAGSPGAAGSIGPASGGGQEMLGPYERGTGTNGRPPEEGGAQGVTGSPLAARQSAPTIRNDVRQEAMPGMAPSAAQAQASRDAGRGTLHGEGPQKLANEGLFAPDTSGQGTLYSFPGMLFDPAVWRKAFGLKAPLPRPAMEVLADKQGVGKAVAEIKALFSPTSLRGAKPMEHVIRRHTAESAQAYDVARHALEEVRLAVDRLPQEEQIDFTDRMEAGQPQATPQLQAVADVLRKTIDEWGQKIQGLGKGYLANAIENYMGHIWGNYREWSQGKTLLGQGQTPPTQAEMQGRATARNVSKQPLRGSGAFLKQRSIPTQREGIDAGLIPVTYNPVDLQLIKIHEMQKFYHGTKLADAIKARGLAHWVPAADERNAQMEDMVKLNDSIFQPKLYDVTPIGPVEPGAYYAPEPLARIFNRYMSEGWAGNNSIYDAFRRSNNALNSVQLGFSGFHAAFVTSDTVISKFALGMQQMARGDIGRGLGNIAQGNILGAPVGMGTTLRAGSRVRREWYNPGSESPQVQRIVDAMKSGGFRMTMPEIFQSSTQGPFYRNARDLKNLTGPYYQIRQMFRDAPTAYQKAVMTPLRIVGRIMDTIQQPLMGALVPRAKAGVMFDLAADWLRRNPLATDAELAEAMTKFQDSVDNRLGQLNYDNLFWDKTLKDIAFVTTRSVGWNLGTVRELAGAFADAPEALKGIASGKSPLASTRIAYTIALPIITAQIGALLTYLATGRGPQSDSHDLAGSIPLDYFYPPVGTVDPNGVPQRRSIPGYMKDVIAFRNDWKGTLANKTSPLIEAIHELAFSNKDYYGGVIYDPERDKPGPAYANFLLNQAMPFTGRAMIRQSGQGASATDQMMAFWGFQPAPASIVSPERGEKYQAGEAKKAYKAREKETGKGMRYEMFNQSRSPSAP